LHIKITENGFAKSIFHLFLKGSFDFWQDLMCVQSSVKVVQAKQIFWVSLRLD
jgi:hypothetical protein